MVTLREIKQYAERAANDNSVIIQLVDALEAANEKTAELQKEVERLSEFEKAATKAAKEALE